MLQENIVNPIQMGVFRAQFTNELFKQRTPPSQQVNVLIIKDI